MISTEEAINNACVLKFVHVGHTPVPMQALQSRLQSNTKPPTWAAWLPKPLQQPYLGGIAETSMSQVFPQGFQLMLGDN